jgi:hypothetical protein
MEKVGKEFVLSLEDMESRQVPHEAEPLWRVNERVVSSEYLREFKTGRFVNAVIKDGSRNITGLLQKRNKVLFFFPDDRTTFTAETRSPSPEDATTVAEGVHS